MTCDEFVERFSDYYDRTGSDEILRASEEHLASCASCRRYRDVVHRGAELLRSFGGVDLPEDFHPRLRHRLYHVHDEVALAAHTGSGATALTVLGIAVLLAAVAWSPALRGGTPVVDLSPIVVSEPPAASPAVPVALGGIQDVSPHAFGGGGSLWDDAPALLLQYSALAERYRGTSFARRAGLDQDR